MEDDTRTRRGATVVGGALVVLLLAVLAATSRVPWTSGRAHTVDHEVDPPGIVLTGAASSSASPMPTPHDPTGLSAALTLAASAFWIFLGVLSVVCLVLVVVRALRLADLDRHRHARVVEGARTDDVVEVDRQALARHVDESLDLLRSNTGPGLAVIECWEGLERIVARAGLVRDPSATTSEFTTEAVARVGVPREPVSDLAQLYRQVCYSTHDADETVRRRALDDLEAVRQGMGLGATALGQGQANHG